MSRVRHHIAGPEGEGRCTYTEAEATAGSQLSKRRQKPARREWLLLIARYVTPVVTGAYIKKLPLHTCTI
eukprot:52633-Eustigmatos_ZCMA.PRE.1